MMMRALFGLALSALAGAPLAAVAADALSPAARTLPEGTQIVLTLDRDLSTAKNKKGDTFTLTVLEPVRHRGRIVVPAGAKGHGEVIKRGKKGPLGSGGKIVIALRYVQLRDGRLPLRGELTGKGENDRLKAAGAALASGPLALLVQGKSGEIQRGAEVTGYSLRAFPAPDAEGD